MSGVTVGSLRDVLTAAGATQIAAMFATYDDAATVEAVPTPDTLLLVVTQPATPPPP